MAKLNFILVVVLFAVGCGGETGSSTQTSTDGSVVEVPEHPGQKIYRESCASCHAPGLSGSPKFGDAQAWAPRIAKGPELLLQSTIEGIPPAMPPRGVCMHCTDEELAQAIDYMVVNSQ